MFRKVWALQYRLCRQAAALAYLDGSVLAMGAGAAGFRLIKTYAVDGTEGVLLRDKKSLVYILAIRGTDNLGAAKTDFRYVKVDHPRGGRVHKGFLSAWNRIANMVIADMEKLLKEGCKALLITGHSLGGALAFLAAVSLRYDMRTASLLLWVFTFGAPAVGNRAWTQLLSYIPAYRIENLWDVVGRLLPPPVLPALWALLCGRWPTGWSKEDSVIVPTGQGRHMLHTYPVSLPYPL